MFTVMTLYDIRLKMMDWWLRNGENSVKGLITNRILA